MDSGLLITISLFLNSHYFYLPFLLWDQLSFTGKLNRWKNESVSQRKVRFEIVSMSFDRRYFHYSWHVNLESIRDMPRIVMERPSKDWRARAFQNK